MHADLIVSNGQIHTLDPSNPRAEAIAIADGRILFVGTKDGVEEYRGARTEVIDAKGHSIVPGFIESHMHVFVGGAELSHLQLAGVVGAEQLSRRIRQYGEGGPPDKLILAQGADYTTLSPTEPITRQALDRIVPDRPFAMTAFDHHTMWANTRALELAGILRGAELPPGNEVVMGSDGLATGELREFEAMEPIYGAAGEGRVRLGLAFGTEPKLPPTTEQREFDRAIILRGLKHCASSGITSFHNMDGNFYQLELLSELHSRGELLARARVPFHYRRQMPIEALEKASEMARRFTSDWISAGLVKVFMDGVIDSRTAAMLDDYADMPGWRGQLLFDGDSFNQVAIVADRLKLQIAVHAVGDAAVRQVLDGYEAAAKANGRRDSRHRVEHVEVIKQQDIARFKELGVLASMQPPHPPGTMGTPLEPTLTRVGEGKLHLFYAMRTLQEAGARIPLGSDWPVASIDPIAGIHAAATRKKWRPDLPDQRVSLMDALHGYTTEGAYAEFAEEKKGKLKRGAFGDLVVLSGDLLTVPLEEVSDIRPLTTICGGEITYQA